MVQDEKMPEINLAFPVGLRVTYDQIAEGMDRL
jgi:hypothetical protein